MATTQVEAVDVSWTQHWPFPQFAPRDPDETRFDVDSDDSDTPQRPPAVVAPHPLSSDSVLAEARRLGDKSDVTSTVTTRSRDPVGSRVRRATSAPPKRPQTATGAREALKSPAPGQLSTSFTADSHHGLARDTVTKEEITALASVFDPDNPLGGRVDMRHLDLEWIVRKKKAKAVTPPAVHLHLGNLGASLEGVAKDRQVLINSPRSALVLLRNGVTIADLKKNPATLSCAIVEQKPFVTLDQLSWEQKKYLALETARLAKLREVVEEYRTVCQQVTFDDVVAFCSAYNPAKPSTAMLLPFAGNAEKGRARRAPSAQCADRLQELVQKFERREDRITRSNELLTATQEAEREKVVARLVRAEERGKIAVDSRLEHVRNMGIASRGRSELWRTQRSRHDRVETFRRMVTREGLQRRLDEVASVQQGMKDAIHHFQDRVRRSHAEGSMQRETHQSAVLRRAQDLFRETQK
jgi:hypothetical protein